MEETSTYESATANDAVEERNSGGGVYCPHNLSLSEIRLLYQISAAISLLVVLFNLLIVLAIRFNEKLRDLSTPLVVSLALADMTFGIGNFLFYGVFKFDWLHDEGILEAAEFFMTVGKHSSMLHLVMIGVDRMVYITRPFKYITMMTSTTTTLMVAFPWLFGLTTALCAVLAIGGDTAKALALIAEYGMYVVIVGFLFGIYGSIGKLAIQQRRRIAAMMSNNMQEGAAPKSKLTKMFGMVLGCFVLLWSPYFIYLLLLYILELPIGYLKCRHMKPVCDIPSLANSAANVVIYSLLNKEYRKTFSRWLLYCYDRHMLNQQN